MNRIAVSAIFCIIFYGCSVTNRPSGEAVLISSVRQTPDGLQVVDLSVRKRDLSTALEASKSAASLRVIPMTVSSAQARSTPEYKLFDIRRGSVGALLGLQERDILVAANDYVVKAPYQFHAYLEALRNEKSAQIEIRRNGKPMLLRYAFTEG